MWTGPQPGRDRATAASVTMASPAPDLRSRWNNSTGGQNGNPDKTTVMIVRHSCINQYHHTASEFLYLISIMWHVPAYWTAKMSILVSFQALNGSFSHFNIIWNFLVITAHQCIIMRSILGQTVSAKFQQSTYSRVFYYSTGMSTHLRKVYTAC